jgi:hypothetical protein
VGQAIPFRHQEFSGAAQKKWIKAQNTAAGAVAVATVSIRMRTFRKLAAPFHSYRTAIRDVFGDSASHGVIVKNLQRNAL